MTIEQHRTTGNTGLKLRVEDPPARHGPSTQLNQGLYRFFPVFFLAFFLAATASHLLSIFLGLGVFMDGRPKSVSSPRHFPHSNRSRPSAACLICGKWRFLYGDENVLMHSLLNVCRDNASLKHRFHKFQLRRFTHRTRHIIG